MLKSMTGYGKATDIIGTKKVSVELKSLNSKQLDMNVKLPLSHKEYELDCRNFISKKLRRGKVEMSVVIEDEVGQGRAIINGDMVKAYYEQIKEIAKSTNIPEPNDGDWFDLLMRLPDVLSTDNGVVADSTFDEICPTIEKAFGLFDAFRLREGEALSLFLSERVENIYKLLEEIDIYEPERIIRIRERIEDDLKNITSKIDIDNSRIEQEMIFYIEKFDVSEEKSRLKCHLDYFKEVMNADSQGKQLGFISQEIGREINTLGSKSNHSQMQKIVVKMKDELEQIKEQILNVL